MVEVTALWASHGFKNFRTEFDPIGSPNHPNGRGRSCRLERKV